MLGADVNSLDDEGRTVLTCACKYMGTTRVVKYLLHVGCDRSIRDCVGKSAADYYVARANPIDVDLLCELSDFS
jgi:ankyrin repeat protein